MAGRVSAAVLEKQLSDVESQLRQLALVAPQLCQLSDSAEVAMKSRFLEALLSKEMEIAAPAEQESLQYVAYKLQIINKAFLNWIDFGASPEPLLEAMPACSSSSF